MSLLYVVRCNFTRADLENAWNNWYNGPKLAQMLAKPLFLSGQRFRATALDDRRRYLALWHVESEQAFKTPEYTSDWGFFEWADNITDWSRDLFEAAADSQPDTWRIIESEFLYLVSFEGLSEKEAEEELAVIRPLRSDVSWFRTTGLDKHSPLLGLQKLTPGDAVFEPLPASSKARETIFEPISHFATSPTSALSQSLS